MSREVQKRTHPIWHVVGCLLFLIIPWLLAPRPPGMPMFSGADFRDWYSNAFMLLFFYLNYYLFIPKLYFKKKLIMYYSLVVFGFASICLVPSLLTGYIPWKAQSEQRPFNRPSDEVRPDKQEPVKNAPDRRGPRDDGSFLTQVKHSIFLYVVVILFSIHLKVRARLYDTERNRFLAELGSLKMQINPHFLFNTLNNIYAFAIREKASNTATSILKLSGMMRYVVSEASQEYVKLDKEINYINNYIELQKMRLNKNLHLSFNVAGMVNGQQIAPLLLITFIENAFKHGVNPDQDSYLSIKIDITENTITLLVENQKVKVNLEQYEKSGVGISNTKNRLALLYPKQHFLTINEDANTYQVQLTLQLK